jgi:dipeptidyl aminopeptidase/acylaminoacyl peptidase
MSNRLCMLISVLVLTAMAASPACGQEGGHSPAVPSIETFMQIGSATSPQVSRDGRSIFFTSGMSGVDQVYRLLPSGWPYQMTVFEDGIDFYKMSPSGRMAVFGASRGGSEQSDLFLIDVESGVVNALKRAEDVRHGSPHWSPDETRVYFTSNEDNPRYFYVYSIDVGSREVKSIWRNDGWNSIEDVSADGGSLLVSYWISNTNSDLYLVDVTSGNETLLTKHDGDYVFDYGRISPDGKTVYLVTNMNAEGLMRVARMDIAGRDIEFLNAGSPWETEEMDMSPDGRWLAWVENVDGYGVLYTLDLSSGKTAELGQLRGIVSSVDLSGEDRAVFVFSSPARPPDIWAYDLTSGSLDQVTFSTFAGIDLSLFVEPQLIRYKSFDGLEVSAFLYLPPGWNGEAIPFVIHAHGGPEGQFRPDFVRHFQYLVLNGYGVLAPNIRGSSGYGREYIMMDDYKKRKDSVRDIYEAARWLVDSGYSEFGRIAIKGASYGGYMTLAAMAEYPEVFGAGIDHIGIANFVTFLTNTKDYRRALRESEYGPLTDEAFLTEISPLTNADRIKAPLLVVHGENDSRVPVDEARQIAEAVRYQGGVAELLIFPDEGHGIAKLSNRLTYYRRMVEFLDEHLKD